MSDRIFFHHAPSPLGPLLLLSDGAALIGLYTRAHDESGFHARGWLEDPSPFHEVVAQLGRYFAGKLEVFDLPVRLHGTPFQQSVWSALRAIPLGRTISYRELATRIGNPRAVRAVGAANGRNPVSIIVPCHRVVGADGDLVGYGGGLDCKRWLLGHEKARAPVGARRIRGYGSTIARDDAVVR